MMTMMIVGRLVENVRHGITHCVNWFRRFYPMPRVSTFAIQNLFHGTSPTHGGLGRQGRSCVWQSCVRTSRATLRFTPRRTRSMLLSIRHGSVVAMTPVDFSEEARGTEECKQRARQQKNERATRVARTEWTAHRSPTRLKFRYGSQTVQRQSSVPSFLSCPSVASFVSFVWLLFEKCCTGCLRRASPTAPMLTQRQM